MHITRKIVLTRTTKKAHFEFTFLLVKKLNLKPAVYIPAKPELPDKITKIYWQIIVDIIVGLTLLFIQHIY
jgi:hypothetical protein